jgi:hypothetical protein
LRVEIWLVVEVGVSSGFGVGDTSRFDLGIGGTADGDFFGRIEGGT